MGSKMFRRSNHEGY